MENIEKRPQITAPDWQSSNRSGLNRCHIPNNQVLTAHVKNGALQLALGIDPLCPSQYDCFMIQMGCL